MSVVALAVILLRRRDAVRPERRRAGQLLGFLAGVALLAYFNFGSFHGPNYLHYPELFHYFLGSKYFPELGYDGLYVASLAAEKQSDPAIPLPPQTRDLRTNRIVPTVELAAHEDEVRRRFTAARWQSFVADHRFFLSPQLLPVLARVRLDHGYNPSPTWTFVGRLFTAWLPCTTTVLTALTLLDLALLAVAFGVVFRVWGPRTATLALILFGLGYPWRYVWVGGALLRFDWLAALLASLCFLRRGRHAAAGALLAYATAVRLFPLLFLFPIAVAAVRDLVRRADARWVWRFAAGCAGSAILCAMAGSLTGRGVEAWPEFERDIAKHRGTWSTNTEGLELAVLYSPATMTSRLPASWPLLDRWTVWQDRMNRAQHERWPFYLVAAALLLVLVAAAAWRAPVEEAAVLGVAAVFALLVLSCYYWVMLVAMPMRRGTLTTSGLLGLNVVLCGAEILHQPTEVTYAIMAWALLALFLAWLLPAALRTLRREPAFVTSSGESSSRSRPRPGARRDGRRRQRLPSAVARLGWLARSWRAGGTIQSGVETGGRLADRWDRPGDQVPCWMAGAAR